MVIKSLGDRERFDPEKLEVAIQKAIGKKTKDNSIILKDVMDHVLSKMDLENKFEITTGYINAIVEGFLYSKGKKYEHILKKYIDNKQKKQQELMQKVSHMGDILDCKNISHLKKMSSNQTSIAASRYLKRDIKTGKIIESIPQWFRRVASSVVVGSIMYDSGIYSIDETSNGKIDDNYLDEINNLENHQLDLIAKTYMKLINHMKYPLSNTILYIDSKLYTQKYQKLEETYYQLMINGIFEPNTPTLMNAGSSVGGLSACFTLGVDDNMASITDKWSSAAFIYKMAGGLGVNISNIRPSGSHVADTFNAASGGINLVLEGIDKVTQIVKSGGKRRGANMGIMNYDHPQILEFIDYKLVPGQLENFNISVMFDEQFWNNYNKDDDYDFHLKFGNEFYGQISPSILIDKIAQNAWASAEPGVLFKDNANRKNPLRELWGDLEITNPCSEQYMYSGESCTLGSINLGKFVNHKPDTDEPYFDFNDFGKIVKTTTLFLNDVLEINNYPTPYIEEQSNKTKRIGLGIMGFADLLFKLRIPFNSQQAYDLIRSIGSVLYWDSVTKSHELADQRGPCEAFTEFINSGENPVKAIDRIYASIKLDDITNYTAVSNVRNMWTTTIAPTGTIAMIADCSNGLEPIFALVFKKTVGAGDFYYLNEEFKKALIEEGLYNDEIIKKVEANYGSVQGMEEIPQWIKDVFLTAMDLHWTDHIVSQAIWQQYIDNSISKTINMAFNCTPSDIKYTYILAHELGLKGVSVYRDGSRDKQVMHTNTTVKSNTDPNELKNIGVKAIVNETIQRTSEPSEATMNYLADNTSKQLYDEFMDKVYRNKDQSQLYIKPNEECTQCGKGVYIMQAGCTVCNLCGHSVSCAVG